MANMLLRVVQSREEWNDMGMDCGPNSGTKEKIEKCTVSASVPASVDSCTVASCQF